MLPDVVAVLEKHGVRPSAQRVAVAELVLSTTTHPSADEVFQRVTKRFPMISRATVYNTLNLFVEKGLLRHLTLVEGRTVFDPNVVHHHHFIDEDTGEVFDVPWDALEVKNVARLKGFDIREYQVVLRGKKRGR